MLFEVGMKQEPAVGARVKVMVVAGRSDHEAASMAERCSPGWTIRWTRRAGAWTSSARAVVGGVEGVSPSEPCDEQ